MVERRRRAAMVLALVSLAVLLSGCLKLDMDVTVSEDDTLSGTMIFAFDKALMEAAGQNPEDALAGSEPLPEGLEGVEQADYEDDKYQGVQYTFDGLSLEEWNTTDTDIRIEHVGDEFVVSGTMDMSTGDTGTGDPAMDEQLQTAFESAEVRIKLTFPGEVKESNGQVDGNSVTWEPKFGEATDISATASAVASGGNMMLLLIIGGVVLLIVIVVVVVVATRKGKGGAPSAEATAEGGFGTPVPAAPDAPAAPQAPPAPAAPAAASSVEPAAPEPPTAEAPEAPAAPEAPSGGEDAPQS